MDYKIKSVRFYQSVEINGVQENFLLHDDYRKIKKGGKGFKMSNHPNGLLIETDTDYIIVSWNNISAIYYDKIAPLEFKKETSTGATKSKKEVPDFRTV